MIDIPDGLPSKVRKHYHDHRWGQNADTGEMVLSINCDYNIDLHPASPTTVQTWFAKVGLQLLSYGVVTFPEVYVLFRLKEIAHE